MREEELEVQYEEGVEYEKMDREGSLSSGFEDKGADVISRPHYLREEEEASLISLGGAGSTRGRLDAPVPRPQSGEEGHPEEREVEKGEDGLEGERERMVCEGGMVCEGEEGDEERQVAEEMTSSSRR